MEGVEAQECDCGEKVERGKVGKFAMVWREEATVVLMDESQGGQSLWYPLLWLVRRRVLGNLGPIECKRSESMV